MNANSVDNHFPGVARSRLPTHPGYLAHWGTHLEPVLRAQIDRVDALPGLAQIFNYPFPVNYVLMLTPRGRATDEVVRAIRRCSTPLNEADQAFRCHCERLAARHPGAASLPVAGALRGWAAVHASGANLDAVRFVESATRGLAAAIPDFPGWAEELRAHAPELYRAFVSLPDAFVRVRRINLYRAFDDAERVLAGLTRVLATQPARRGEVARVELAKRSETFAEPGLIPPFPTLIVYLEPAADITVWWRLLAPLLHGGTALEIREDYARRLGPGVTCTEGFRLYKRYLAAIGLLDAVYDRDADHAIAREPDPV